ncbi:hypothetical protein IB238_14595 [Rhizobium sp. ARZ01]|uniref:hypothetical protein n=1 Tax=Rhizobium sp. ARZ01 TaxID=2769313 RepID=UPI00177D9A3C|nr:hypothetical protein [Rhizobium sp. ARZ01]MBD9373853.1 hypothetical protein [Rhizobium sp. ARZ01]
MSVQLARYLKDFSAPRQSAPFLREGAFAQAGGATEETLFDIAPPEPQIDIEVERAEAFAAGRAEAEAELDGRHQEEIAALRNAHAMELAELRTQYEQRAAAMVAERFSQMADTVADLVAGQAANVLAPVLDEALSRKAVADMAALIRAGVLEGEGIVVTVRGPSHLFEQLKSHFEGEVPVFRHLEADDLDLAAEFGETVLVTRMAAWADTVRKVLA